MKDAIMEHILNFIMFIFISLYGIFALILIFFSIFWLINKSLREKQLSDLRAKLLELQPTDPEYNQARALYISMMIDAHQRDIFYGSSFGIDGSLHQTDTNSHGGSDHSDGGAHIQ
jgi:hypothetical protein